MGRVLLWAHRLAGTEGRTGIGRYVVELTRALAVPGHAASGLHYDLCAGRETEEPDWVPPGVGVQRLGMNRQALHLSWTIAHRPRIERLGGPADLVHALYPAFPTPSRAPLVVTVHDVFALAHPEWFDRFEGWANRRALAWTAGHAAHVIADSQHTKDQLVERLEIDPARITVVWLGVDDRFSRPSDERLVTSTLGRYGLRAGDYVVTVGAVNERKNMAAIVDALAALAPPLSLVIAGPAGSASARLQETVDRLGVAERVRVTGFVPDDELRALVQGALALVHPSLDEGFGFTPLEAMAAGIPAIVAASGSLPEVVGDAALVVGVDDRDGWAGAIEGLRRDPDRRARLAALGPARSARFTWAGTAEATAAIHRRLAGG